MKNLYCCYSVQLRDFLCEHGVRYSLCALNPNTHNMFWAYIRNEKLDKLLSEWSSVKN
jgi:hypothetical protein